MDHSVSRFRLKNCLVACLTLFVTSAVCVAAPQDSNPTQAANASDYSDAVERLSEAIRFEVESKDLPAFSIALVDNDTIVWAEGFGFEDPQQSRPATADTVYRVGSVSKLFTDIAALSLAEQGKVDLDAPVQTYLPNFKPNNPFDIPITLRQLMSHQSGLVRESPVGNYFDPTEPTLDATVESLNKTSLVYRPQTRTKYSNAAIAVVGAVLESQRDESHPEYVKRTILEPLGMDHSGFVIDARIKPSLATGWMRTYDDRKFEAPGFLLGTGPAGNLYASMNDLGKFLICLLGEGAVDGKQIVNAETLKEMMTPIRNADGIEQGFGLGFHIQSLDGYKKVGHGGAVYGFSTQLEALPGRKLGVAASTSLDVTNGIVGRLSNYALRLMMAAQDGKELPEYVTSDSVPNQRGVELLGTYRDAETGRFARVTEYAGDFHLRRGTFRYRLGAASKTGDLLIDDPTDFGRSVKLVEGDRLQVGSDIFVRSDDEPPAAPPEHWRGLIGEYGWDHNTLYILEENGKLYALIEWFFHYPLTEIDANTFAFPDYGLYHGEKLKFVRDANGNATEVTAAEVKFVRREVGTKNGETFKIDPIKPIEELRVTSRQASPPAEEGDFRESELVDLVKVDPAIKLDVRYATTNNFMGAVFYKQPRAFMQRPAALALAKVNQRLAKRGLGLLVHDAYRPWYVTKMFWDATPSSMKDFVANPANGSRHNRGCAVDLTLYDRASGEPIEMVAGYDEFSPRSFPRYPGGTSQQRWYRQLLRESMEAEGFAIYEYEWWHFDYKDWRKYRIGNLTFEEIDPN